MREITCKVRATYLARRFRYLVAKKREWDLTSEVNAFDRRIGRTIPQINGLASIEAARMSLTTHRMQC